MKVVVRENVCKPNKKFNMQLTKDLKTLTVKSNEVSNF